MVVSQRKAFVAQLQLMRAVARCIERQKTFRETTLPDLQPLHDETLSLLETAYESMERTHRLIEDKIRMTPARLPSPENGKVRRRPRKG